MTDMPAALARIAEIIEIADTSLPKDERQRLHWETKSLIAGIDRHVEGPLGGDADALEKTHSVLWHVGAALGLDETNGHGPQQHRSWAMGDFWSLKSILERIA